MHLGLIGAGNISSTHLRAAQIVSGVTVAAVYSRSPERAHRLADQAGLVAYESLERFLAHKPLDAVAIGTPSGMHAEQAIAAAERGLHILVEKPVDISTERIDALIATADRHNVKVGVFFQDRLKPDLVRVKRMLEDGALGKPVLASGHVKWFRPPEYYANSTWRGTHALDGGGALINQGIHTVDLLQWFFGPVASVVATVATRLHSIEAEDTAAAVLTFDSGAMGIVEAGTSIFPGSPRRIELTGSEGTFVIDGDALVSMDLRTGRESSSTGSSGRGATAAVADPTPHARIIEDFVHAIETGRPPACDAREGRKSVTIVEAVYRSARTGRAERVRD